MRPHRIKAIGWAAMLLGLCGIAPAAEDTCRLTQYAELPVTYSPGGGLILPVTIVGRPASMLLVLTAGRGLIFRPLMGELGLKLSHTSSVFAIAGQTTNDYTVVPELRVGNVRYPDWDMLVWADAKRPAPQLDAGDPVGWLGADLFRNYDIELDLGHNRFRIFSHEHCPGKPPVYWSSQYNVVPMRRGPVKDVYFVMEVDGKKLETQLATGGGASAISTVVSKVAYGWDGAADDADAHSSQRTVSLTAPGLNVTNARVMLMKPPMQSCLPSLDRDGAYAIDVCLGLYPLMLGTEILKKLRIYMAVKEEKLYFTSWDAQ